MATGAGLADALLRSSRAAITVIDLNGAVTLVNDAGLEAMEAGSFDAIRGQPWSSLWAPECASQIAASLARAKRGKTTLLTVYRLAEDGAPCWWNVTVSPVFDEGEAVVQILSQAHKLAGPTVEDELARELSEQRTALILLAKQLEDESRRLSESRRQASQAEKVKLLGQFSGGIVHDINNVLAVMASACRILRKGSPSEQASAVLGHADVAIERGTRLVRKLLDFARVSSEDPEIVYLDRLLSEDAELLHHLTGHVIGICFDLADDLWPVLAAPGKLQAILFNLVANARDAMPNGGRLTVQVRNCHANERPVNLPPKDFVALTLRDTGKGMTPDVLARAGEPFFTTKQKGQGTGLGLASAFDFADQCGGEVSLESAAGVGTAITIHIPRAAVVTESRYVPPAHAASLDHGGATILLVESDDPLRRHVGALLRSLDYAVIEAASPQQALAAAVASVKIDLIVANLDLAKGAGFELLRETRPLAPAIPRIFLTEPQEPSLLPDEIIFRKPIQGPLLAQAVLEKLGRASPSIGREETLRIADRLRDRIRNPKALVLYDCWRRVTNEKGHLPSLGDVDGFENGLPENTYLLEVVGPQDAPSFRFVRAGSALLERLGRDLQGEILRASDHDVLGSITRAFQRCLKGVAYFDYTRFSLGDGRMLLFERLLLPVSSNRTSVTHLFGVATFDEIGVPLKDGPHDARRLQRPGPGAEA
jgi:PAS domain S-box-containing protein